LPEETIPVKFGVHHTPKFTQIGPLETSRVPKDVLKCRY